MPVGVLLKREVLPTLLILVLEFCKVASLFLVLLISEILIVIPNWVKIASFSISRVRKYHFQFLTNSTSLASNLTSFSCQTFSIPTKVGNTVNQSSPQMINSVRGTIMVPRGTMR